MSPCWSNRVEWKFQFLIHSSLPNFSNFRSLGSTLVNLQPALWSHYCWIHLKTMSMHSICKVNAPSTAEVNMELTAAGWLGTCTGTAYICVTHRPAHGGPTGWDTEQLMVYTVTELAVTAGIHYDNSYIIILYTYNVFNFIFFVQKFDVISEFELNNCRRLQSAFNSRYNPSVGYFNLLN